MPTEFADVVSGKLRADEPVSSGTRLASVAIIFRRARQGELLMIKRADIAGDPWSGQIAFPGGKSQPGDRSLRETAARETLEEVGIDLRGTAKFLGYFGTFRTHTGTMDVVPAVFNLEGEANVRPNQEVSAYRWVPLSVFSDPAARTRFRWSTGGSSIETDAYAVDDWVVWGLTFRIVSALVDP